LWSRKSIERVRRVDRVAVLPINSEVTNNRSATVDAVAEIFCRIARAVYLTGEQSEWVDNQWSLSIGQKPQVVPTIVAHPPGLTDVVGHVLNTIEREADFLDYLRFRRQLPLNSVPLGEQELVIDGEKIREKSFFLLT